MPKPWEKYASMGEKPSAPSAGPWTKYTGEGEEPSTLEALARGGGQGLSLGFSDELTGGVKALIDEITGGGSVMTPTFADKYRTYRDQSREANLEAEKAHPVAYGGSRFVGAVAPAVAATVATKGAAAPAALRFLAPATAAEMAALAGVEGVGYSESSNPVDIAKDAALSSLMGYGVGKAVPMAGRTVKSLMEGGSETARESADFMASKALGLTKGLRKKFKLDPSKTRDIGRRALEEGVITPLSDATEMATRASALRDVSGGRIGAIMESLDQAKIHRPSASRMMTKLAQGGEKYMGFEGAAPIMRQYKTAMGDLNRYQLNPTFENLQRLKKVYKDLAYPKGVPQETKYGFQDAFHAIKREMEDAIDEGVQKLASSKALSRQPHTRDLVEEIPSIYRKAKADYGASKMMQAGLEDRIAVEEGNRMIKLTDFMVGGAVGIPGGIVPAVGAVAAKRGIEKYGYQVGSVAMHNLAKVLQQAPQRFGRYSTVLQAAAKRGTQSLATTHYILQQKDPEYRKMVAEMDGRDK